MLGCPAADSGAEGAGGGAFHPSVVVAFAGMPQLLSQFSFAVGLLDIGEGPAFVRVDSGGSRYIANWRVLVFRGIPRGICV